MESTLVSSVSDKATNPSRKDEDWDAIMAFCDQVNKELEGPQISVRLIAHKIQSPQEREALFALTVSLIHNILQKNILSKCEKDVTDVK